MMKTLLSIFDYSGEWSAPFAAKGWNVICLDKKNGFDITTLDSVEAVFDSGIEDVDGIIAAPPCTAYAVSGAKHWGKKYSIQETLFGKYDPVAYYDQLVTLVLKLVDLFCPTDPEFGDEEDQTFFWTIENPVGRIAKRFPELEHYGPPYYFDPCDFAGYLKPSKKVIKELNRIRKKNGIDITDEEARLIYNQEVYTKRTGLWGDFNHDLIKKPITHVPGSPSGTVLQRAGGKSEKTKTFRSNTPFGFAQAFCNAQHNYKGKWYQELNDPGTNYSTLAMRMAEKINDNKKDLK